MATIDETAPLSISGNAEPLLTKQTLAITIVLAAVLFNFVLCFLNTSDVSGRREHRDRQRDGANRNCAGPDLVPRYEAVQPLTIVDVLLFLSDVDPFRIRSKNLARYSYTYRFLFLGCHLGLPKLADRLVTFLIFIALSAALFEWLALNTFLHYFDVIHYYLSRGTDQSTQTNTAAGLFIKGGDSGAGLFINATRFEPRVLLPSLGSHRASGIFLEPVSVGNFAAIAFAWVLLHSRSNLWGLSVKTLAIAVILVLADARYGCFICISTLALYLVAPMLRPTMLFAAPFVVLVALVTYAEMNWNQPWDNSIAGRLLSTGNALLDLGLWQILGLKLSEAFATGYAGDSGYGYVLVKIGLAGITAIWALFVYAPVYDPIAWRFKNFTATYVVTLLTISASLFSIKTAALLWFLNGTLNNPHRGDLSIFGLSDPGSVARG